MGFLHPLALLALPLALLPLWLEWRGLRSGEPIRFSSLYLLERARRAPAPRLPTRSRWVALLRVIAVAALIVAAARPVGCGAGDPASHRATRAIVAVDVSASAGQLAAGVSAWDAIAAAADSLLAAASPEDRLALAAVADGIVGWWEGSAPALRERLSGLGPGDRPSDWPRTLDVLAERADEGTETYLLTDGSAGAVPPLPSAPRREGYRVVGIRGFEAEGNRALAGARWVAAGEAAVFGRAWGSAPATAEVGRARGGALEEPRSIPLDGTEGAVSWVVPDSATVRFREGDAQPADDRLYLARGGGGQYEVVRWAPADDPPESGSLFWAAALEVLPGAARVERTASLAGLAERRPHLALLPIRAYRPDEAALLASAARAGTRLLFSPACPTAACAPPPGWFPAAELGLPDLALELPAGSAPLSGRVPGGGGAVPVPEPLLDRAPVRGGLAPRGGAEPDWTWDLATGRPALWARGPVAIWLIPLGPPHTRLGTTPVFPLVTEAALSAWDPRWGAGAAGTRVGEPLRGVPDGASVTGPLHAGDGATTWEVPPGGAAPRPDRAGLYRVRDPRGSAIFVAVNGDAAEGDLTRVPAAAWEAAWGPAVPPERWRAALFPRRRGPELWPWALVLAMLALAAEAAARRVRADK
ncbi:MAG TPA: BatA domain-containing protein [Gemmatimonadota bacterium]|nr:BatA domain-containing protein [Gemmatimonadota bacterium]